MSKFCFSVYYSWTSSGLGVIESAALNKRLQNSLLSASKTNSSFLPIPQGKHLFFSVVDSY